MILWSFVRPFDGTTDCIAHLRSKNFASIATFPHRKGVWQEILHEADYTTFKTLAVWFGNESKGVTEAAVANAEFCVGIPMFGMVESLNLGTSSGIVL
jgi:tRNA (guanosine-2'-O-)-methyltransferase